MPDLLFIYGTLHPDRAPETIAPVARRLTPFGGGRNRATLCGRLYDLGAYPGLVLSDDPSDVVAGELFLLPDTEEAEAVLSALDDYEDFRPDDPEGSLFLRQFVAATTPDGDHVKCWVYTYNRLPE